MIAVSSAMVQKIRSTANEYNAYNACGYSTVIVAVNDIDGLSREIAAAGIINPQPYMTVVFGDPQEPGYGYFESTLPRCHTIAFSVLNDFIDNASEAYAS